MCLKSKRFFAFCLSVFTLSTPLAFAQNIMITGPSGEQALATKTLASKTLVSKTSATKTSITKANDPSSQQAQLKYYGPTTKSETLWSIASRLKPNNSVSVQQTLLAIFKLNPQSFDQQNINQLMPNSRLRVPSLTQIKANTTQQAIAVMNADSVRPKAVKLNTPNVAVNPIAKKNAAN